MPTAREAIANRMLSGSEVRELLLRDFERILQGQGLLNSYVAYGRIGYTITLALHLDNPMVKEADSVSKVESRAGVAPGTESVPLANPSADSTLSSTELSRNITSPNAERLRHGLSIPVESRGPDGITRSDSVSYPPQPELGEGDVTLADATAKAREAWGIPVSLNAAPKTTSTTPEK